jgi:hypothetical protein
VLPAGSDKRVFLFCSWNKLLKSIIFLLSKWSAVFPYNAVALLNSRIIDSNYSSKEQRGATWVMKMLKFVLVILLAFLQYKSILFVLFIKSILW